MSAKAVFLVWMLAAATVAGAAPKYVFLFIGDGMAAPQRQVAESFSLQNGLGRLAMNEMPHKALTRTQSSDKLVTDSAAAATAIACGEKTKNGRLGVRPDGSRLESVAEVARRKGMKVGIMTSVTVYHATPAGFYAHRPNRGMGYEIGLDLVESGFDFFAGGAFSRRSGNDKKSAFYRGPVVDLAKKAGYTLATDKAALLALKPGGRYLCLFDGGLPFAIDAAKYKHRDPTLAQLLTKSIELLDGEKGFFIMCEGGKIDYAGHANDAATNLRDVLALDEAVKVALAFEKTHPGETLVLVTGDHETGGLTMGEAGTGGRFDLALLGLQTTSVERFSNTVKRHIKRKRGTLTLADLQDELWRKFGFILPDGKAPEKGWFVRLSAAEVAALEKALAADVRKTRAGEGDTKAHDVPRRYVFAQAVKNVLNARAGVAWNTTGHTALPTLTTAAGADAGIVDGMTDNTDISKRLKELLAK
jgi:alkaline phosphatase